MPAPIIVVHDDDDVRQAAMAALRAARHECAGFAHPMAALDAIEDNSQVRVLVTRVDFGAGALNGVALARMLRSTQRVRVVFVALPENELHTKGMGVFLPMPLDPPKLVEAVEQVLTEPN
jgi:DNA-binding NtrC family response regulator